ncbi:hypothetical protein [Streptomyces albogriseolus]|uniref:hypothetical protein n=1 Tax=Streptomyces albogriseolus TaxID=1887 RepID=UPI0033A1B960
MPDAVGDRFAGEQQGRSDRRVVPVGPPLRRGPLGGPAHDAYGAGPGEHGEHVAVRRRAGAVADLMARRRITTSYRDRVR